MMTHSFDRFIQSPARVSVALLVLALACYVWVLPAPFKTVDDYFSIVENPLIRDFVNLPEIFTTSFFGGNEYYRPLVTVSFMLEYKAFGLNSFLFNLTNLLLHAVNGFLVFMIIRAMSRDPGLAFLTAALFVVHPIHWEAVANIPGRSILLSSAFGLWSFWRFQQYIHAPRRGGLSLAFSMVCLGFALLSRESAVMFPVSAALYILMLRRWLPKRGIYGWGGAALYAAVAAACLGWRQYLGITAGASWGNGFELFFGFTTFLTTLAGHMVSLLVPATFYFDRAMPLYTSLGDPRVWMTWIFWWVIAGFLAFVLRRRNRVMDFCAAWFFIHLLPVARLVPISISSGEISAADHFYYLPAAGFLVVLVVLFRILFARLRRRKKMRLVFTHALTVGYALFLALVTIRQAVYAGNPIVMFEETLKRNPDNDRIRFALAAARADFERRLELDPEHPPALFNLAGLSAALGEPGPATELYERFLDSGFDNDRLREMARRRLRELRENLPVEE